MKSTWRAGLMLIVSCLVFNANRVGSKELRFLSGPSRKATDRREAADVLIN